MNFKSVIEAEIPEGSSLMARLDHTGDTRVTWSRTNEIEIGIARDAFNKAKKEGFMAYKVTEGGAKGEVLSAFDPQAERIILAPPMRGGR